MRHARRLAAAAFMLVAAACGGGSSPAPGAAPVLELSATELEFAAAMGGGDPAVRTVTVANGGDGALARPTAEVSYLDGAGWLGPVAVTGDAAPYRLSIQPSCGGLVAGTYRAAIAVGSPGAVNGPRTIAVRLLVGPAAPILSIAPAALGFAAVEGEPDPAAQVVTVEAEGGAPLAAPEALVSYVTGQGWLRAVEVTGAAPPYAVHVRPAAAGLAPGSYQATVALAVAGAAGSPGAVDVTLEVTEPPPTMAASAAAVAFQAVEGGADPAPQSVTVANAGGGQLLSPTAEVQVEGPVGWLTAAVRGAGPFQVDLVAASGSLPPGLHRATVTLTSPGATNSPSSVEVTFDVAEAPPVPVLSPPGLAFSATVGGADPAPQEATLSNDGGGVLGPPEAAVEYLSGAGWIGEVEVSAGERPPYTVTVRPAAAGLAAGTYLAIVRLNSPGAASVTLAVALTVGDGPVVAPVPLASSPLLAFSAEDGAADPAPQAFTVSNAGGGALAPPVAGVSYQTGGGWITGATVTGAAAPYQVSVQVSARGLLPGTYVATLALASFGATEVATVAMTLEVKARHVASTRVSPASLTFATTTTAAGEPAAKSITVAAFGDGSLPPPVPVVSYLSGAGWIASVTVAGEGQPYTVTVQPAALGLPAGTYLATLTLTCEGAPNPPVSVPIVLTVGNGQLGLAPTSITRSGPAGSALGASLVYVSNAVAPPVAVPDYGAGPSGWLDVSVTAPVPPSTSYRVSVTPLSTGLAAGTYQASVVLRSDGAAGSPRVLPVRLTLSDPPGVGLVVSPPSVSMTVPRGTAADPWTISIGASGTGALAPPTISVTYQGTPSGWLQTTLTGSGPSWSVKARADSGSLPAGCYVANVSVHSEGAINTPMNSYAVLCVERTIRVGRSITAWAEDGGTFTAPLFDVRGGTISCSTSVGTVSEVLNPEGSGAFWADVACGGEYTVSGSNGFGWSYRVSSAAAALDLGLDQGGRVDASAVEGPASVALQLTGLQAWDPAADEVLVTSWDAGLVALVPGAATAGATSGTATLDLFALGLPPVVREDHWMVAQARQAVSLAGDLPYRMTVSASRATGAAVGEGSSATLAPPRLTPPPAAVLRADWRTSQFEAGLPPPSGLAPPVHDLSVLAVPVPLTGPSPFRRGAATPLLDLRLDASTPVPDTDLGALPYGAFLPGPYQAYRYAGYLAPVSRAAPGAAPADFLAHVSRYDALDAAPTPIIPMVTGVTGIRIAGKDAAVPNTGVGTTPQVSWSPPVLGTPTSYRVTLYRLANVGGETRPVEEAVVVVRGSTTLALLPASLVAGTTYVLALEARVTPADDGAVGTPFREALPLGSAVVYTQTFSP